MIKCPKCQLDNMPNTKFCHHCGYDFSKLSIMDRFPEFNFRPTTVFKIPGESKWMFAIVFLTLVELFVIFMGIGWFCVAVDEEDLIPLLVTLCAIIVSVPLIKMLIYCCRRYGKRNIQKIADYVQTTSEQVGYYIVVKDSKFGLYDYKKMQLAIPCEHTYLSSKGDGLYLVEKDGSSFIVDKFNNRMK